MYAWVSPLWQLKRFTCVLIMRGSCHCKMHLGNYCNMENQLWGSQFLAAWQIRGAGLGTEGRPGSGRATARTTKFLAPAQHSNTHWEHSEGETGRRHNTTWWEMSVQGRQRCYWDANTGQASDTWQTIRNKTKREREWNKWVKCLHEEEDQDAIRMTADDRLNQAHTTGQWWRRE